MAKIGVKYPCFKPDGAASGIVMGEANKIDINITNATGELPGDDRIVEYASEFSSGTAAIESTYLSDENATILFGHTATNGRVVCNSGDTAPYGRFAYYRVVQRKGVKYYKAFGYYRTCAELGNESDQTKGSNITFSTDAVSLKIVTMDDGSWREYETFATEQEAISFVNNFCSINTSAALSALSFGSLTLTPAFDADTTAYSATTTNATNTITATAAESGATVEIKNGETTVTNGTAATWSSGTNTVTITVTNGGATKTYTIVVTKSET